MRAKHRGRGEREEVKAQREGEPWIKERTREKWCKFILRFEIKTAKCSDDLNKPHNNELANSEFKGKWNLRRMKRE